MKQEEEGVDASEKGPDLRLYAVAPDKHILVAIKNLSLTRDISFRYMHVCMYVCMYVYTYIYIYIYLTRDISFRTVYVDDKGVETDSSLYLLY